MHLEGRGRNEISRILAQQGLHVSEGSVGNIIRAYRKNDQSLQSNASVNGKSRIEQASITIHRDERHAVFR